METIKDVEMRLEFCNSSEPVIKYDQEKVRQRYLEQRKNLAILQYILGKTPTDDFQGKMDKNRKNQANIFLCNRTSVTKILINNPIQKFKTKILRWPMKFQLSNRKSEISASKSFRIS